MKKRDELTILFDQLLYEAETTEVLKRIQNSKICIIDDKVQHLSSMIAGLKAEGFNNIKDYSEVSSINEILSGNYDVIILDLSGVAAKIDVNDGIGVLKKLKQAEPFLPILVVTGNQIDPRLVNDVILADLIRYKPVLSADLANDIKSILIKRLDPRLASVSVIREIERLRGDISQNLRWLDNQKLNFHVGRLKKNLIDKKETDLDRVQKITDIASKAGPIAIGIGKLIASII